MALYKFPRVGTGVTRTTDGAFIPSADANLDWQAYQKWLTLGNITDPSDPLTAEEQAAAAEAIAQATLSGVAKVDTVFTALKTATDAQIATFVTNNFGTFTAQQRAAIKLLLMVAALVLRKGVV